MLTEDDRCRVRRRSEFLVPPRLNLDRNDRARLMFLACAHEHRTYIEAKQKERAKADASGRRARPVHGGEIGKAGLLVLRTLLFGIPKQLDCLFPALLTICACSRLSVPTVVAAIKRLVRAGFLTVHRRCKLIRSVLVGWRTVQDSNAYVPHPPTGLGPLGTFSRPWSSDLKNWPGAPKQQKEKKETLSKPHASQPENQPKRFTNYDVALAFARRTREALR